MYNYDNVYQYTGRVSDTHAAPWASCFIIILPPPPYLKFSLKCVTNHMIESYTDRFSIVIWNFQIVYCFC